MKRFISLLVAAALAAPMVGCETNIDADDEHPGRGVGHVRHDDDTDVNIRAETEVPDVDVDAKGSVDVD